MPLFLTGFGFRSTLTLVNNAAAPTYAAVTLRNQYGQIIAKQRVTFKPHHEQVLDLASVLEKANSSATRGSILIAQSPDLAGPAVLGTLAITYNGQNGPSYLDEEPSAPDKASSPVLIGVADRSQGPPLLAISSLTGVAQHVTVECFSEQGALPPKRINLLAGYTSLQTACGRDTAGDDADPMLAAEAFSTQGTVGIRLTSDGTAGSFAAFALAPHAASGNRTFSGILFSDPNALQSSSLVFTGIPVGSATLLPSGTYTPVISLANFSAKPLHIQTTFTTTAGGTPRSQQADALTLAPGTSREVVLDTLQGDPDLQNSFIVKSDGAPGALMAKLVSHGDSRLQAVELQAKDGEDAANAGVHPWSLKDGTESTLLLFNHSDKLQHFTVAISGSEIWQKTYALQSMETKAISIGTLVADQTKDDSGRTLSKTSQNGEVTWFVPNPRQSSGRLLQSNRSTAMARSYSCGYNNLLCGATIQFYQSTLFDGTVADFANITALTCTSGSPNACNGQQTGTGGAFNTSWSSGSPNIASVSGSSAVSNVNLQGNAAGNSGVSARIQSSYCSSGGGGTATVLPVPQIFYSGQDVSFKTLDGLIGIQIPLTASINLPPGMTASNPTWTIPDAVVGGYSISKGGAFYTPVVKNPTSTTFYWTKGGHRSVTYTVTFSNGATTSASTYFNVIVPDVSVSVTPQPIGPVSIVSNIPDPKLTLGPDGVNGIVFTASLGAHAGSVASYSWVQLLTSAVVSDVCLSGARRTTPVIVGLDTSYPYAGPGTLTAIDNPSVTLRSSYFSDVQVSETYNMYLMFDAGSSPQATAPTIPISLGYVTWNWSGEAVQNGTTGSWSLRPNTASGNTSGFNVGGLLPTWGNVSSLGGVSCPQ